MSFRIASPFSHIGIVQYILGAIFGAIFIVYLHARFFSPIRHIPGPFLANFGTSWQLWHVLKGDYAVAAERVHKKYGKYPYAFIQVINYLVFH